jgi:beta-glucanase (GH16 family)
MALALILITNARAVNTSVNNGGSNMATWSDQFSGPKGAPPDYLLWNEVQGSGVAPEGGGNNELETYTPEALAMDGNGNLVITASEQNGVITSGKIWTIGIANFRYGNIAINAAFPDAGKPGYWPGIWMLGSDYPSVGWPLCGEIDIAELFGINGLNNQFSSSVHTSTDNFTQAYTFPAGQTAMTFHTYSLAWRPTSLTFSVDGTPFETINKSQMTTWEFDKPFFIILNLAIGGTQGGPVTAADLPYTMLVHSVIISGSDVTP